MYSKLLQKMSQYLDEEKTWELATYSYLKVLTEALIFKL